MSMKCSCNVNIMVIETSGIYLKNYTFTIEKLGSK